VGLAHIRKDGPNSLDRAATSPAIRLSLARHHRSQPFGTDTYGWVDKGWSLAGRRGPEARLAAETPAKSFSECVRRTLGL
jgi:hypothetical protein